MTLSAEYDRCLEADNLIAQRVECAEDEYREISNEILIIDQRLASLEKAYAKGGGISKKEWRSMQDQIAKRMLAVRDTINGSKKWPIMCSHLLSLELNWKN